MFFIKTNILCKTVVIISVRIWIKEAQHLVLLEQVLLRKIMFRLHDVTSKFVDSALRKIRLVDDVFFEFFWMFNPF